MKQLNQLEKTMFKIISGWSYEEFVKEFGEDSASGDLECARAAAQVAIDLATRAIFFVPKKHNDGLIERKKQFLTSEGIDPEDLQKNKI